MHETEERYKYLPTSLAQGRHISTYLIISAKGQVTVQIDTFKQEIGSYRGGVCDGSSVMDVKPCSLVDTYWF